MSNIKRFITFIIIVFVSIQAQAQAQAQDSIPFQKGKAYQLGGIAIKGLQKYSEQTVRVFAGLKTGQTIKIPGDKLTSAIKKLYNTKQFSNVDVYVTKVVEDVAYIEFDVVELPEISTVTITGIKKGKAKELQKEAGLKKGEMVTDDLLITTKNYIQNKYAKRGYLKSKVTINTKKDTSKTNAVKMLVHIDNGERVKIKKINFSGNKAFKSKKLRKAMSNTKQKMTGRFWKKSKYLEEDYQADLESIIDVYSEKGYRDARIVDEQLSWNQDNTINLDITVSEGKKYYFGDIKFIGNSLFTDAQLQRFLRIEKGDIYNAKVLKERVNGDNSPDSQDINTTYLNRGYMAARVNPVETRVNKDSIDVEIRIFEGLPFRLKNVSVVGNDKTNDHVIYRELRTKPGNLFSKEDIIRSIRELGQLGFFDAQTITPDVKPNYTDQTADIEYAVTEKGSSQIELQGGYGGNAFIGTLGLTFNNFSIRNIFNKKAYKPLPMGDGQALSLRIQKSKYYSTYSFSFTEPWLGGKRPKSLSFSIYNSKQFAYDRISTNGGVDRNQQINILGASVGLGQRLQWPDDYFTLSQTVSIQQYKLKNYRISTFSFDNGTSNNIAYAINLGRSSAGPGRIFPQRGSEFNVGIKLTPPYSLFNKKDYANISDEEKYNFLEYYKASFKGKWYTPLFSKIVMMTNTEFGFLGKYNNELGDSPFERFYVGGDGLGANQFDGRETIGLRGYDPFSGNGGGTIYNKFTLEMRYPITLKPSASIYVLGFLEGGNSYTGLNNLNPFDLKRSAGLGMRIFMPAFGLLGIDFGHGFDALTPGGVKPGWGTQFIIGRQF